MRILVVLSAIVVAVSALVIFYGGGKVAAATLTVNSTADTDDGACDPLATGECTLREAVNLLADGDTIAFAIPGADPGCNGAGVCTILSGDRFDIQSADATVDGYTQPGASPNTLFVGNDVALKIQITSSAPEAVRLQAPRITAQSLVINGSGNGIVLNSGGTDALIRGNFIGTDATGTADASAGGIGVTGALGGAVIGETIPQSRNVISGLTIGIRLLGNFGNTVQNNYIGTDASGKLALANDEQGIWISASDDNMIGGKTASARNVISGNGGQAVLIGRDLSGGGGAAITASRATTSAPTQPVLNRSPTAPRRLGLMLSISKAVRRITSSAALPGAPETSSPGTMKPAFRLPAAAPTQTRSRATSSAPTCRARWRSRMMVTASSSSEGWATWSVAPTPRQPTSSPAMEATTSGSSARPRERPSGAT